MYIKKVYGYVVQQEEAYAIFKGALDSYDPPTVSSGVWKHWISRLNSTTCPICKSKHGEIYSAEEVPSVEPPLHSHCHCEIVMMEAVLAGIATKDGTEGADWWIKNYGVLPEYYISEEELTRLGWRRGKSPAKYAPGKMPAMGIYRNGNGHLPQAPGRIWYEADINYYSGKRNRHRLVWSNDGLVFVTYDHYETFIEVK